MLLYVAIAQAKQRRLTPELKQETVGSVHAQLPEEVAITTQGTRNAGCIRGGWASSGGQAETIVCPDTTMTSGVVFNSGTRRVMYETKRNRLKRVKAAAGHDLFSRTSLRFDWSVRLRCLKASISRQT